MTLAELNVRLRAASRREERQRRFQAQMVANIMNCWIKDPIDADVLLGVKKGPAEKSWATMSEQEKRVSFDQAWALELHRRKQRANAGSECERSQDSSE